jgi:pimeloyl-ACP methyl ester carboxylesterase
VIGEIAVKQDTNVFYRMLNVEGLEIFNREAGRRDGPTVLLLHGFPP